MEVEKEVKPQTTKLCGAKTRSGGACKNKAGKGTDHPGEGKCRYHGGATPIKHGRYSKITRPRIKELIEQFENDPDPFDLLPEVKLLRALCMDYIERYDEYTEALLEWHESFTNPEYGAYTKPTKVMDIISVGTFISQIGSLVEKIQKQKDKQAISMEHLYRVMQAMGTETIAAIREVITDDDTGSRLAAAIQRRWETIRVEPGTNSD